MKKFGTAVNCMDGRVQEPVINYMKENYGVDYVDMVTEPGPDKILAENSNEFTVNSIKERIDISVNKHGSEIILMVGHTDCAGNPVEKNIHLDQTIKSTKLIQKWHPDVKVVPVWIDENWNISIIN